MVRIPSDREPTHPGEMLLQEFLLPLDMTQRHLATAINVPFQRVNEIIRGRRGVTPSTALRLARFFGTSPDFWINLQLPLGPFTTPDAPRRSRSKAFSPLNLSMPRSAPRYLEFYSRR